MLLYDPETETLLTGNDSTRVIQYKKNAGTFTLLKDYEDVGDILASAKIGHYAFFGGWDYHKIVVINLKESRLCEGTIKTAFKHVYSLQVCRVSESRTLFSVRGENAS